MKIFTDQSQTYASSSTYLDRSQCSKQLCISVGRYHGTIVESRYFFFTVPVPSRSRYYRGTVPQYHEYRGTTVRYLPTNSVTVDWFLLLTHWRSLVRHVTMRARAARRVVSRCQDSVLCCAHVEFYRLYSCCRVLIRVCETVSIQKFT